MTEETHTCYRRGGTCPSRGLPCWWKRHAPTGRVFCGATCYRATVVTEPLSDADLDAIAHRSESASAWPWKVGHGYEQNDPGTYLAGGDGRIVWSDDHPPSAEDEAVLAHDREDVVRLLAEVRRIRACPR